MHTTCTRVWDERLRRHLDWPCGYSVDFDDEPRKANAIACQKCDYAIAEIWRSHQGERRWLWYVRRGDEAHVEDTKADAVRAALAAVRRLPCLCEEG